MSQIHNIVAALDAVATVNPMADALATAGFVGGLHQGTDASRDALKPFGLLTAERVGGVANSSGVELVTYRVSLQVIADENVETLGSIIKTFHRYWDRLLALPALPAEAKFVLIFPEEGEMGELEQQQEGKDIVSAVTSWTLKLSESQPALET